MSEEMNTAEVYEVDKLTLLNCAEIHLKKEPSGYLTLEYGGKTYRKIDPTRLIPFYSKTKYISLHYENEEREFREVGVIKDMAELPREQFELLNGYLEYKYFMPEITRVYSIRDNMRGAIFVKTDTTAGEKTICVRDWYQNFRLLNGSYLYVNDADGNKYFCPDISKLDKKSLQVLEMFT